MKSDFSGFNSDFLDSERSEECIDFTLMFFFCDQQVEASNKQVELL